MTVIPTIPAADEDFFSFARQHLFSAVIGDVLDTRDLCCQFLPPAIQPLAPDIVLVGRAMPVAENGAPSKPFGLMFRALDELKPGEIYMCTPAGNLRSGAN